MQKLVYSIFVLFICFIGYSQTNPTAQFTANPLTICVGENVTFTSTSTAGSSPINEWSWDFGDGSPFGTTEISTHAYSQPGTYTVILVVKDQNHVADPEVKLDYINVIENPTSNFTINANSCLLPVVATFNNQSSSGSNYTYDWNFGNTQTSTSQSPIPVTYSNAGNYTISLKVTNTTNNCHSSISKTINVSNFQADFIANDSICAGSTLNLTDKTTLGVNDWSWSSDNGLSSTNQNPSFFYSTAGTYTISLTAKNTVSGCSSIKTKQLVVVPKPVPSFTVTPSSGCIPLIVSFSNTSPNGTNFIWDFGDGSQNFLGTTPPNHTYSTNGSFNVSLTSKGVLGCLGTTTNLNAIQTTPTIASFGASLTEGCSPLTVQFNDLSSPSNPVSDPITSWLWAFGDGTTSTLKTPPSKVYTTGLYSISLTVTTQKGCIDSESKTNYIQVGDITSVDFTNTPIIQCAKSSVDFTNQSVITALYNPGEVTYDWDFGDGGAHLTQKDPTYSFPVDTGYFNVKLTVKFRGCIKFKTIDNAVFIKSPISVFSPAQSVYCNPTSFPVNVAVTDISKIGQKGDDIKMIWKWGDPLKSTKTLASNSYDYSTYSGSSSFNYLTYGSYTIWQVIHNYTTGCVDSTSNTVSISKVDAAFSLSNDSICKNNIVIMTGNATTPAPGSIVNYSYSMGDPINGATSGNGIPTAQYQYTTSGNYTIILTATDSYGCTNTSTLPIKSLALPLPQISFPSNICGPALVTFTNTSTKIGNGYPDLTQFDWTMPRGSGHQITNDINTTTQFNFASAGNFHDSISLVATDGFGCVSLPTKEYINMSLPSPSFTVQNVICNGIPVTSTNTTIGNNSYKWYVDYQNNSSPIYSTNQNTNFSFNESANTLNNNKIHTLKLVVTDQNGCKDSINQSIAVSIPKADFDYLFTGANMSSLNKATCPPVFADLTNQSSAFNTSFNSNWIFGDGKTSNLKSPHNTYVFAKNYTATLKITDQYGCIDDTTLIDYLTIGGPSTDINFYSTGTICDNLYFFDTLNSKSIDHLIWDFGDGTTATTSSVEHDYPLADSYAPKLTIYDSQNCSVEYLLNAFTLQNEIKAYFTYTPKPGKTEESITFDDQSVFNKPIVSWFWEFGDFDTTTLLNNTDANTSFTYDFPYIYQASLTVTDANGCLSKYTTPIHIKGDFKIANVFTPNNDGVNDTFKFFHDIFKNYDITILNRWDNVVYEKSNASGIIIWDGSNQNKEQCTEGVYFYIVNGLLMDGTPFEKVGFVTKI